MNRILDKHRKSAGTLAVERAAEENQIAIDNYALGYQDGLKAAIKAVDELSGEYSKSLALVPECDRTGFEWCVSKIKAFRDAADSIRRLRG